MKAANGRGEGLIISLTFNPDIPIEAKALRMSQRLAAIGHGVRKSILIASLAALADFSEHVGKDMTTEELSAWFLGVMMNGGVSNNSVMPQLQLERNEDEVLIETDARGVDFEDIANNFVGSSSFSGGNDDLWD